MDTIQKHIFDYFTITLQNNAGGGVLYLSCWGIKSVLPEPTQQ